MKQIKQINHMTRLKIFSYPMTMICFAALFACGQTDSVVDKTDDKANLKIDDKIEAKIDDKKDGTKATTDTADGAHSDEQTGDQSDAAKIKRGKLLFVKATCWGCHPHGDNSVNGDKPLKGANFSRKYKTDEELAIVIRRGNEKAGMPPFPPEKLKDAELKQIIFFVRSLSNTRTSGFNSTNGR